MMKIGSSLIDSAYKNRIEKSAPVFRKNDESRGAKRAVPRGGFDTINLSTGFSLEKIQGFLQTEIGKKINTMMAEAGIDFEAAAGLDWSPDAVSDRIFNMSTGLFGVWRDQHSDMSEEALIDSFEKVIRTSVDKGASEAVALIGAVGFGEETRDVTDETMSLLHEKLDAYFSDLRNGLGSNTDQTP